MRRPRLRALRETFAIVKQTDPNTFGKSNSLTTLIPVLPGQAPTLEAHLAAIDADASPFARLSQLHFSRLFVLNELVYQGAPQVPESLDSAYLIFTASFDGDLEAFLHDVAGRLGSDADAIFRHTRRFPGTDDGAAFARWVTDHQVDNGYSVTPWPFETAPSVREALRVQRGFGELVTDADRLDDHELRQRFRDLMKGER